MKKYLFAFLICAATNSMASSTHSAIIKDLMLDRDQGSKVFINLDIRTSSLESCHSNTTWEYVLDISDELGLSIYSSLLTLYATGKPASFKGTGICTLFPTIEDLRKVTLN